MVNEFAYKNSLGNYKNYTQLKSEGKVELFYAYFMALISFFLFLLHNLAYAVENEF